MKKAFTLAEILITLGIVGVVAALTTPALIKHTGQAEIGPKLAKFANTFENGTAAALREMRTNKVSEAATSEAGFMELLSKHIAMTPAPEGNTYNVNLQNEAKIDYSQGSVNPPAASNIAETFSGSDKNVYILKDGSVVCFRALETPGTAKGPYKGVVGELIYDIDGNAGTNIAGREVFKFLLDNSGQLVPYGSSADKYLNGNDIECAFIDYSVKNNDIDCSNLGDPSRPGMQADYCNEAKYNKFHANQANSLKAAYACTGKIADNGYKAEY